MAGIPTWLRGLSLRRLAHAPQIAFDAADNIYVISAATERLRIYSLGLTTTATTGSDGAFQPDHSLHHRERDRDTDTIYDSWDAGNDVGADGGAGKRSLTGPLTVSFSTGGTAVRGSDYVLQTNGVTVMGNSLLMPAGVGSITVSLVVSNDTTSELTETATFNITGTTIYSSGAPNSASVAMVDNDANMVDISAVAFTNMFEANPFDVLRYTVQRRGDTNAASYTVNLGFAGTATSGVDYTSPAAPVTIDPGVVTVNFDVNPLNDTQIESPETVIASVTAGAGYAVGTNTTLTAGATGFIVDNDQPAETVLFSENFTNDVSANWTLRFSDTNSPAVDDYSAIFAFDYSSEPRPFRPPRIPVGTRWGCCSP